MRWINYERLPSDLGYPMYAELDNILGFIVDEYNKREKERIDQERKNAERQAKIDSDLRQMTKGR